MDYQENLLEEMQLLMPDPEEEPDPDDKNDPEEDPDG